MSKLFRLIQVNLISYFNFYKVLNGKGMAKLKELMKFCLLLVLYIGGGFYIYYFAKLSMNGLMLANAPYVLLGEFFAISSVFCLLTTVFRVDSVLFNTKDYEMLISMPIAKKTILLSKMINLYISNLFFIVIIMIPVFIVYTKTVMVTSVFCVIYFLSMLVIPLLPTVLAVFIGSVISFISSRFKVKKLVQFVCLVLILAGSLLLSFNAQGTTEFDITTMGEGLLNIFNKVYPLTNTYMKMVVNTDMFSMILFFAFPIIVYAIVVLFLSFYYTSIVSKIKGQVTQKKYKMDHKISSQTTSLLKKEFKRYFSSPNYIVNSSSGIIMMLLISIGILFIPNAKIEAMLGGMDIENMLVTKGPFLMGFMFVLSCTSSSSISLEGKNWWILKSMPVDIKKIFLAKILMNFLILMVPGVFMALVLHYVFHLGVISFLLWIVTMSLYAMFISIFGLIINLCFPLLVWENEVKVIKQSMATLVTVLAGIFIGSIPLIIKSNMPTYSYIGLVDGVFFLVIILLYLILERYGKKLVGRLNG